MFGKLGNTWKIAVMACSRILSYRKRKIYCKILVRVVSVMMKTLEPYPPPPKPAKKFAL
jgi:hypothetical protein